VHFWNGQELASADVAYSMLRNMTAKDTPLRGGYYKFVKSITVMGPFQVTVHLTNFSSRRWPPSPGKGRWSETAP
jgi:MarR-like DNA-binding transcriptional regulator SgrR of sgrS sRNA